MSTSMLLPLRPRAWPTTESFLPPRAPELGEEANTHARQNALFVQDRHNAKGISRLARAVVASLMLHLGLAILVSSSLTYTVVKDATRPPLTVSLAQAPAETRQIADVPVLLPPPVPPQIQGEKSDTAQQPARFLIDPDLSVLEEIPTTIPGSISLRLNVTSQGTVERVTVIRADPVPKELLDGLIERFGKAKLSPAMVGSQPKASSIEVTIRVDPPAQFFNPAR